MNYNKSALFLYHIMDQMIRGTVKSFMISQKLLFLFLMG